MNTSDDTQENIHEETVDHQSFETLNYSSNITSKYLQTSDNDYNNENENNDNSNENNISKEEDSSSEQLHIIKEINKISCDPNKCSKEELLYRNPHYMPSPVIIGDLYSFVYYNGRPYVVVTRKCKLN